MIESDSKTSELQIFMEAPVMYNFKGTMVHKIILTQEDLMDHSYPGYKPVIEIAAPEIVKTPKRVKSIPPPSKTKTESKTELKAESEIVKVKEVVSEVVIPQEEPTFEGSDYTGVSNSQESSLEELETLTVALESKELDKKTEES